MKNKIPYLIALLFTTVSFSQTIFTLDSINYEVISTSKRTLTVKGKTSNKRYLNIPENVTFENKSYTVTEISANAFEHSFINDSIPIIDECYYT